ncbi:hypothetical protein K502DRAFT_255961 [Neoconidiobolus thromboides FSU 785]|nr:hypothetical protein K502DRAFT_255961 [Neoconidiobolus thromboides FSU 785]
MLIWLIFSSLFIYSSSYTAQNAPRISGGNCALVKDKVYYLGGSTQDNDNKVSLSKDVYVLDLSDENFMINKDQAKWTKVNSEGPPSMYGNIIQPDKDSDEIYMIGGEGSDISAGFQIYNVKTNKWKNNEKASKELSEQIKNKINVSNAPLSNTYLINVVTSNENSNTKELYYFSGKYKSKDNTMKFNENIYIYNIEKNAWRASDTSYSATVDGAAVCLKSSIQNFGGTKSNGKYQDGKTYNTWSIDAKSSSPNTFSGANDFPTISKFSYVYGENNEVLYVLGGTDSKNGNVVYNMTTLTIRIDNQFNIDGLESYDNGCLVYYKKYLIYSFGSKKDSYSNKTQLIRLSNKELTEKYTKDTPEKDTKTNIGVIIGGSVGGFIGLIGIVSGLLYFYYLRKKSRKKKQLRPPKYIKQVIWAGKKSTILETSFIDSFGTQLTYIDDDVTDPENVSLFLTRSNSFLKKSY